MHHIHRPRARWATAVALAGALVTTLGAGATVAGTAGTAQAAPAAKPAPSGARPDPRFGPAERTAAIRTAQRDAARTAARLRMGGDQRLVARDVTRDADQTTHTRYERTYRGLPVVGGDFVVHRTARGALSTSFGRTKRVFGMDRSRLTPTVRSSQVPGTGAKQVVYADQHAPTLAWQTRVTGRAKDGTPIDELVFTDARTGRRLGTRTRIYTDDGIGKTLYSGKVTIQTKKKGRVWRLTDDTRGGHKVYNAQNRFLDDLATGVIYSDADNKWGDFTTRAGQSAAADAAYGAQATWDWYQSLGRNGIRDDGVGAYSRVHFGKGFANAFWSDLCFCMTYGDGAKRAGVKPLVSLDVAGHEMSHGVTANTAGLDYFGDAGGLNEATSDVMGTMVEFQTANPVDVGDYLIGEKVFTGTPGFLRRMDDPTADGLSLGCWKANAGTFDPHFSSGVGNHAFYLMAEGSGAKTINGVGYDSPVCSGGPVSGVGRLAAAQAWYRALATYWVSTSSYADAADGMVKAAVDLFGTGSAQCSGIKAAWQAVNVAVAADCTVPTGSTGNPANLVADGDFEAVPSGWTQTGTPAGHPLIVDQDQIGLEAHSGTRFAWLGDQCTPFPDCTRPIASNDAISQTVVVPAGGESTISFYLQTFTGEDPRNSIGADPLTVEINGTPIKTYDAFYSLTADFGWQLRRIAVPASYSGQTVTLTFRGVNDDNFANTDWFIDDVVMKKN